jgi:hypothetical protein
VNLIVTLEELADRLGLRSIALRSTDGRPKLLFLAVAGLVSLALWTMVGWSLWRLIAWLIRH